MFDASAPTVPGHYAPAHRPLADVEALAASVGATRLVIVQPSVYGTDHRVMLGALAEGGGRHRGVAVLDASVDDAALDALHAAGVRGARFNRVSPVGHAGDPSRDHAALAPRLAERGWHLQWYAPSGELAAIAALHARGGPVAVLDHLAGVRAGTPDDDPCWDALARLADAGAWVKLSGWYRLGADAPWDACTARSGACTRCSASAARGARTGRTPATHRATHPSTAARSRRCWTRSALPRRGACCTARHGSTTDRGRLPLPPRRACADPLRASAPGHRVPDRQRPEPLVHLRLDRRALRLGHALDRHGDPGCRAPGARRRRPAVRQRQVGEHPRGDALRGVPAQRRLEHLADAVSGIGSTRWIDTGTAARSGVRSRT